MSNQRYIPEFKVKAVRSRHHTHLGVQGVAEALDINPLMLSRMLKECRAGNNVLKNSEVE
ncbi:hypothetical protein KZO83_11505 [Chromohalobacter sp. TMW 2.2308]|uniref:hypothetical protein n=1 Tax=Chromohalobacter TaxID=42054 RepID=UPI001FFD005F|nr:MULTISPECIES: hypothetical protein [Chromohalobacter]MCK2043325.1 hypothetical protein [Chromohalobacter moromii]MCT8515439.1 hypothetical protein [Chromohalobacter sp. TMW 2.2271]